VISRIRLLANLDLTQDYLPTDLVRMGVIDPVKIFVKNEPHKTTKLSEDRVRLIYSVSLIDNLIGSLLFDAQNKREIEEWDSIPSQPGIGFSDEKIEQFLHAVKEHFKTLYKIKENDIQGWDFSMKPPDFDLDLFRRALLNNGFKTNWYKVSKAYYFVIQFKVFVLSDGTCFAQVYLGIMPSGWNNTASTNSAVRVLNHLQIAFKLEGSLKLSQTEGHCKAAGDDSLERELADNATVIREYALLGKQIKEIKTSSVDEFTFCSQLYKDGTCYPINHVKQLFSLLHYNPSDQGDLDARMEQFKFEHRHSPKLGFLLSVIAASGWLNQFKVDASPIGFNSFRNQNHLMVLTQTPRDCTVSPYYYEQNSKNGRAWMYSPCSHQVSNTMTKKNNKPKRVSNQLAKIKSLEQKLQNMSVKRKKSDKPFASTGSIIGKSLGGMFGFGNAGHAIGKTAGSLIGSIFGSGDYEVVGPPVKTNTVLNSAQIPQFRTGKHSTVIAHREYVQDITGTAAFTNLTFPLNPGIASTFPWLSTVAQNFQEFRIKGLVFEFRSLLTDFVTNGQPGVIVLATNYNADALSFTTKAQMENSEFAVSTKPTVNMMHGLECAVDQTTLKQRYVRTGAVPANQDLRLYDWGNFQLATQANPVVTLGELWVSYEIEFFKPILPLTIGGDIASAHVVRSNCAGAAPFGLSTVTASGSLPLTVGGNTFSFTAEPGTTWMLSIFWAGTAATLNIPTTTPFANCSFLQWFTGSGGTYSLSSVVLPFQGSSADRFANIFILKYSGLSVGTAGITLGTSGTIPTVSYCDIYVSQLDSSLA